MATNMATRNTSPIKTWDHEMTRMRDQLAMVLPSHLGVDRMARTARMALQASPKLLECNRNSLWKALMSSALFGLEVDGRQSAIIPFRNTAQWIPMVNGLVTIAFNSGFIVQGEVVRKKDQFDVSLGLHRELRHKPARGVEHDRDNPVIGAYAIASHRNMPPIFEWMDLPDILRVRDGSKGYQYAKNNNTSSVWIDDFRGMARKTPIRALCNHLPWNVQKAVEVEDEHDAGHASWAVKNEETGVIEVEYASFDDQPPADNHRPAAKRIDGDGNVTEADHAETMRQEGAEIEARGAQGELPSQ